MSVQRNVIILTAGLTGSSVVAGLLKDAGYWTGSRTAKKQDYDTFENHDLVAMNDRLLREVGYRGRFDRVFRRKEVDELIPRFAGVDIDPFLQFLEECNRHQPWVWKDPRLCLTIPFWLQLLKRDHLHMILLSRQQSQVWISHILRRQIQTPHYCRAYMNGIYDLLSDVVKRHQISHLELNYEDLLLTPERTLEKLANFLGTKITMDNLCSVYHGRLYRRHHGVVDYMYAILVLLKNYSDRADILFHD